MTDAWAAEAPNSANPPTDGGDWGTNNGVDAVGDNAADTRPAPPPLPFERRDGPIAQWEPTVAYDYNDYSIDAGGEWAGNAEVYHWDGEQGDIGPESAELENMLFGQEEERATDTGYNLQNITGIQVFQESEVRVNPIASFDAAGLHPAMRRNVELAGYKVPTPIQQYCLPAVRQGHDMIAVAQTGSGKTAAYLIPILDKLMGKAKKWAAPRPDPTQIDAGIFQGVTAEPLVVIVCPARELAVQIFNEARKFCYRTMLRPAVVYGGGPIRDQIGQLQKGCDILIASPGRLIDFMSKPQVLSLRRVKYMVIDEADEMLHQDWEQDLNQILSGGEQEEGNIKYMLFSATFPAQIRKLAKTHLAANHVRIRVGRIGSTHANIIQQIIWVDHTQKKRALLDLLYSLDPGRTIIFVNNKRLADELDDFLFHQDMPCTSIHADRTQREREDALRAFKAGKTPILIATGVTARGIDIRNVKVVINYDMPNTEHGGITEYTHRIGRTGRAGLEGKAISFYTERDEPIAEVLTKTLLETEQEVPDFLQQYIPEGVDRDNLQFEAGSDEEDEAGDDDSGAAGWGADGGNAVAWDNGNGENQTATDGEAAGWGASAAGGNDTWGTTAAGGDTAW